jgi:NAD(P)-dependent dehydrogenase (short-subunit alcohol dehydrogenase family)
VAVKPNRGAVRFAAQRLGYHRRRKEVVMRLADKVALITVAAYGRLDVLVNNAGISGSGPDTLSVAVWDRVMDINAKGVLLGMKSAIPAMQRTGGGAIVNISSISGFVGQDRIHMAYNASKGAVRIMTKSAAVQRARDGIRVNSVPPASCPHAHLAGLG